MREAGYEIQIVGFEERYKTEWLMKVYGSNLLG